MELTAREWCQNVVAGWNLGNTFEGCALDWNINTRTWDDGKAYNERLDWEVSWMDAGPHYTTQADIKAVAAAGFNAVRIPVRWEPHVKDHATMEIDPAWVARVKQVVDWCLEENMYVLINTHHEHWLEWYPFDKYKEENNAMLGKLWTNIAKAFADYDGRLAFAGCNEVHEPSEWVYPGKREYLDVLNSYHETFVQAVRATGGKNKYRNLVVQTYVCAPKAGITVPKDVDGVTERLSVEFHYYQPWDFCGGEQPIYSWNNTSELEGIMDYAKGEWWNQGYGVIIGEYGCSRHFDANASASTQDQQLINTGYYNNVICKAMRARGFAGFVWDNYNFGNGKENFGIFNRHANMRIDNKYIYAGIVKGCGLKTDMTDLPDIPDYTSTAGNGGGGDNPPVVIPDIPDKPDLDITKGETLWTGDRELNWGDGLQLNIPASKFKGLAEYSQLVLDYTGIAGADYRMVQLVDGQWSETPIYFRGNNTTSNQFENLQVGQNRLTLTIPASTLKTLQSGEPGGMWLQGHGVSLNKVTLVNAATDQGQEPGEEPGEEPEEPGDEPGDEPGNDPEVTPSGDTDWYTTMVNGEYTWTGNKAIAWGTALEINKNNFAALSPRAAGNQLVVFYEITAGESMIQFLYNDIEWKALPMPQGNTIQCAANAQNQAGKNIMIVDLTEDAVTALKSHNLVMQGVGTTITGVIVVDGNKVAQLPAGDANADSRVTVADVVSVIDYLAKQQKAEWMINTRKADVNSQQGVDKDDVSGIVDLILAK